MKLAKITFKVVLFILVLLGTTFIIKNLFVNESKKNNEKNTEQTINNDLDMYETSKSIFDDEKENDKSIEKELQQIIANMTLDDKIGQLFLARVPDSNQLEDIKDYNLGGYLLFNRDIQEENFISLKEKIESYQNQSKYPMLIASDEEGGSVTRISRNNLITSEPFKSPRELYEEGGMESIILDVQNKSKVLKSLGIHTGLFPVADTTVNPNSFIYDRTLGLNIEETSQYVANVVVQLSYEQIGSTLKHFPGYGDNEDSHTEIVYDSRSIEELQKNSIPAFEAGIESGVDSVLVSHNIVESIDNLVPASISSKVIRVLRDDLGFDGVIMTDDMDMAGLSTFISQEEAAIKALQAGNDMILSSSYKKQIPVIKNAVLTGEYKESDLNNSVFRILRWKQKLGIIL